MIRYVLLLLDDPLSIGFSVEQRHILPEVRPNRDLVVEIPTDFVHEYKVGLGQERLNSKQRIFGCESLEHARALAREIALKQPARTITICEMQESFKMRVGPDVIQGKYTDAGYLPA